MTGLAGVPHTYALLDAVDFGGRVLPSLPSLRYLTQAGGRMAPDRVREYAGLAREHGVDLFVMYGQTEATARMAYLPPELVLDHPDTIGVPIPGGSFRLAPVPEAPDGCGELVYAGPNVMMGYAESLADLARGPELTELHTGDLARFTDGGLVAARRPAGPARQGARSPRRPRPGRGAARGRRARRPAGGPAGLPLGVRRRRPVAAAGCGTASSRRPGSAALRSGSRPWTGCRSPRRASRTTPTLRAHVQREESLRTGTGDGADDRGGGPGPLRGGAGPAAGDGRRLVRRPRRRLAVLRGGVDPARRAARSAAAVVARAVGGRARVLPGAGPDPAPAYGPRRHHGRPPRGRDHPGRGHPRRPLPAAGRRARAARGGRLQPGPVPAGRARSSGAGARAASWRADGGAAGDALHRRDGGGGARVPLADRAAGQRCPRRRPLGRAVAVLVPRGTGLVLRRAGGAARRTRAGAGPEGRAVRVCVDGAGPRAGGPLRVDRSRGRHHRAVHPRRGGLVRGAGDLRGVRAHGAAASCWSRRSPSRRRPASSGTSNARRSSWPGCCCCWPGARCHYRPGPPRPSECSRRRRCGSISPTGRSTRRSRTVATRCGRCWPRWPSGRAPRCWWLRRCGARSACRANGDPGCVPLLALRAGDRGRPLLAREAREGDRGSAEQRGRTGNENGAPPLERGAVSRSRWGDVQYRRPLNGHRPLRFGPVWTGGPPVTTGSTAKRTSDRRAR